MDKNIDKPIDTDNVRGGTDCISIIGYSIADYYKISYDDMIQKSRKREYVMPRQMSMSFCSLYTKASLSKIGIEHGGKDHATVLHAKKVVNNLLETDKSFKNTFSELDQIIKDAIKKKVFGPYTLVCNHCGSPEVLSAFWIEMNTRKILMPVDADIELTVCKSCNQMTTPISKQDFLRKEQNKETEDTYVNDNNTLETLSVGVQTENKAELRQGDKQTAHSISNWDW